MTEQEQKAFKLYGKVPAKNVLTKMQKVSQCSWFKQGLDPPRLGASCFIATHVLGSHSHTGPQVL